MYNVYSKCFVELLVMKMILIFIAPKVNKKKNEEEVRIKFGNVYCFLISSINSSDRHYSENEYENVQPKNEEKKKSQ